MSDSIRKMEREMREYGKIIENLEDQIQAYKANELQFEYDHNYWKWEKKEYERKLSKVREELDCTKKELTTAKDDLEKFSKSSKALESIIKAQVTDDLKRGIGYNNTPPPYNQNYIPPTTDLLDRKDRGELKEGLDRVDPVDTEEESEEKSTTETIPDDNHILTNEKGGMPFVPSKRVETFRKDKGKAAMSPEKNKEIKTKTTRKESRKDYYTQRTIIDPASLSNTTASSGNNSVAFDSSGKSYNSVEVNTAASNNSSGNSNTVTTDGPSKRKPIITKYSSHVIPSKDYMLKLNRLVEYNYSNQGRRSSLWHVDSGCSRHMTGIMSLLEDFKRFEGGHVAFGDNPTGGKISGKRKVSKGKMTFDDVYYVEQLRYNLLSVSQVCDKKFGVFFTNTECLILAPGFKIDESQVMLRTPRKDNVYCLDIEDASSLSSLNCLFSKASVSESSLWHRRMCHMNFKNMNLLVKNNLVRGLPAKEFSCDDHCVACLKGKKSYCLVIVDDYSRFTWVYFLKTKDETSGLIKPFVIRLENKTNLRVKVIRSDNGTEFKNADLNSFCEEKGIERQYSAPRTPQQNGVAERRNRTLIEAARTRLAYSKLPITFWATRVGSRINCLDPLNVCVWYREPHALDELWGPTRVLTDGRKGDHMPLVLEALERKSTKKGGKAWKLDKVNSESFSRPRVFKLGTAKNGVVEKKARKEDDIASKQIFHLRNQRFQNILTVDLYGQRVQEEMKILKAHLLFGACVKCGSAPDESLRQTANQYWKSAKNYHIQAAQAHDAGDYHLASHLSKLVIKLLDKEDIQWTLENEGTIFITLNGCTLKFSIFSSYETASSGCTGPLPGEGGSAPDESLRQTADQYWKSAKNYHIQAAQAHDAGDYHLASHLSKLKSEVSKYHDRDLHVNASKKEWILKAHLLFGACVKSIQRFRVITGRGNHACGKSVLKDEKLILQVGLAMDKEAVFWPVFIVATFLGITIGLRDTNMIAHAYGLAVSSVMFVTTCLMTMVMIIVWKQQIITAVAFFVVFGSIELLYLSAAFFKVPEGGWIPLLLSLTFMSVMFVWNYGKLKKHEFDLENKVSMNQILSFGPSLGMVRVPGIGLVYTNLVPYVGGEERMLVGRVGPREFRMFRCIVRYGYKYIHHENYNFENRLVAALVEYVEKEGKPKDEFGDTESDDDAAPQRMFTLPDHEEKMVRSFKEIEESFAGCLETGSTLKDESVQILRAREAGIAYILGHSYARAKKSSSIFAKLAIDVVYSFLSRNCRGTDVVLNVPHTSLLEVGMIYYV
ncbi:hypothetical protein OSB04_001327 [Centaurea solstitialis]|uniref:Integrase catalytic domain-containing protein n=1 Tax=Centaurea solstitialis TaxID=347529 RepID=A0AA38U1C6_9ASTR|nr:hypothetical protein OSB04_001327 [Centaurea solstitialis]